MCKGEPSTHHPALKDSTLGLDPGTTCGSHNPFWCPPSGNRQERGPAVPASPSCSLSPLSCPTPDLHPHLHQSPSSLCPFTFLSYQVLPEPSHSHDSISSWLQTAGRGFNRSDDRCFAQECTVAVAHPVTGSPPGGKIRLTTECPEEHPCTHASYSIYKLSTFTGSWRAPSNARSLNSLDKFRKECLPKPGKPKPGEAADFLRSPAGGETLLHKSDRSHGFTDTRTRAWGRTWLGLSALPPPGSPLQHRWSGYNSTYPRDCSENPGSAAPSRCSITNACPTSLPPGKTAHFPGSPPTVIPGAIGQSFECPLLGSTSGTVPEGPQGPLLCPRNPEESSHHVCGPLSSWTHI